MGTAGRTELCGITIEHNTANEGGGAIVFVSNDRTGSLSIRASTLRDNPRGEFEDFLGMFVLAKSDPAVTSSTVE